MVRMLLTDQGAALASVGQLISEDEQRHGEAEHQSDFKGAAFSSLQWQSTAPQISYHDKPAWENECYNCVERVGGHSDLRGYRDEDVLGWSHWEAFEKSGQKDI